MQTQTIKVDLKINNEKVEIGHQFLEDISSFISDLEENTEVFGILALSDNPEVREEISRKDNLSKKTIHLLLDDENQDVVDNILNNTELAKKIDKKTLFKIVKKGNIKLLCTIALNIDDYELCNPCKLAKILSNHKNASVRYNLVRYGRRNNVITEDVLHKLAKDEDIDVAHEAKENLK